MPRWVRIRVPLAAVAISLAQLFQFIVEFPHTQFSIHSSFGQGIHCPALSVSIRSVSVSAHPTCNMQSESQGARETPSRFVQGFLLPASAARRFLGVDVRAVGNRVASMATDPGLPGRQPDAGANP